MADVHRERDKVGLSAVDRDIRGRQNSVEVCGGDIPVGCCNGRVVGDHIAVVSAAPDARIGCSPGTIAG